MTSLDATSLQDTAPFPVADRRSVALPMAAWVLNAVGVWPIGLAIAYVERGRATPEFATQYRYLIRTVLIGAVYLLASLLLCLVLVGYLALMATAVWFYARCIRAMLALSRGETLTRPSTWLV